MFTATKEENITNLKNSAQNLRSTVSDVAEDAKHDLRTVAGEAGRKVRSLAHSASDELEHAKDTVSKQIRTNPLQAAAIALGAGFVLGALFRR